MNNAPAEKIPLRKWLEPEVRVLDMTETSVSYRTGGDGSVIPDNAHL